ncbi:MAG: MBL fold metallo-hydrolase [Burkholderiales bacterium]
MLQFKSLGSGSTGNATLVAARQSGMSTRLLVDCGLGIKQLDERLAQAGTSANQIDGIFITHEHADHIGCARALALRERIPVWMSRGTHAALNTPDFDGLLQIASDGVAIELGALQVMPFTVPHDAREPLQLVCRHDQARLGIVTDLGHCSTHVMQHLAGCQSALLEFNHDTTLLAQSAYPPFLRQRIGGNYGHLSNDAAAAMVQGLLTHGLQCLAAAHLSRQNNRPELVRQSLQALPGIQRLDLHIADEIEGTAWLDA